MSLNTEPLQSHQEKQNARKKGTRRAKLKLPNGQEVNFGNGNGKKNTATNKGREPQLPNGEKPSFALNEPQLKKEPPIKKEKKHPKGVKAGVTIKDESYAGLSFHSSPEALALPKPSFGGSPRQNTQIQTPILQPTQVAPTPPQQGQTPQMSYAAPNYPAHFQQAPSPAHTPTNFVHYNPALVYQGIPQTGPPAHPVQAYPLAPPAHFQPNYGYRNPVDPVGFRNYPPPMTGPMGPIQPYGYAMAQPQQPHPPAEQKITFNELLGSGK